MAAPARVLLKSLFIVAATVTLTLAHGCGALSPFGTTVPAPAKPTPGARAAYPVAIDIPVIDAWSTLSDLAIHPDGAIEVPPVETPEQAGWYALSARPGERGAAVILGHVDGGGKRGVFYNLKNLTPGDAIYVARADETVATFEVTRVVTVRKDEFPTDEVYGNADGPELRLITCGGVFDPEARSYESNVIVFASLEGDAS